MRRTSKEKLAATRGSRSTGPRNARCTGLLRERNFRLFLLGYTTSMNGTGVVPVALSFALLKDGRSAQDVGFVFAAQTIPLVVLLLIGGVAADRSRKGVMVSADLARCLSEAALAALFVASVPALYVVSGLASVLGIGQQRLPRIANNAGLGHWSIHELRHSCASLMFSMNVPLDAVSDQLGHASIGVTKGVYVHLLPGSRAKAAQAMEGLLFKDFVPNARSNQNPVARLSLARDNNEPLIRTSVGRLGLDPSTLRLKVSCSSR